MTKIDFPTALDDAIERHKIAIAKAKAEMDNNPGPLSHAITYAILVYERVKLEEWQRNLRGEDAPIVKIRR